MAVERTTDQFISGPESVAGCHGLGGGMRCFDAPVAARRTVRTDVADQTCGGIHSGEYRGRSRAGEYRQLRSAFANLTGFSQGTGDTFALGRSRRRAARESFAAASGSMRKLGQNASCSHTVAAGKGRAAMMPFAIRYSLFAKARSAA